MIGSSTPYYEKLTNSPRNFFFVLGMQQRARLKVVESLRNSKKRVVCVSTDVAARGLDFPSLGIIVHYDVARNVDTFIHRSGRTAVRASLCRALCRNLYDYDEHDVYLD